MIERYLWLITLLAGLAMGALVQTWRKDAAIANIEAAHSRERAQQDSDALKANEQATAVWVKRLQDQAAGAGAVESAVQDLGEKIDKIRTMGQRHANAKPMPPGCVPDSQRVRDITEARAAANSAITAGRPGRH